MGNVVGLNNAPIITGERIAAADEIASIIKKMALETGDIAGWAMFLVSKDDKMNAAISTPQIAFPTIHSAIHLALRAGHPLGKIWEAIGRGILEAAFEAGKRSMKIDEVVNEMESKDASVEEKLKSVEDVPM